MGYNNFFNSYFVELNNLTDLLNKYANAYRLLIGGAGELNNIADVKKSDLKDSLERVYKLGDIMDDLLKTIDSVEICYMDYLKIKAQLIGDKSFKDDILTEVDNELLFQNSTKSRSDINDKD
ncbi:hypothetical protein SAMN02745163_02781 [Clostridium cavendishii DSM 21758]|uniref:Uncharacterized protein n=1 Tax=Clostridium cavendishii DSM 21758 TaxID=1121302 RepID=A0A1M6MVT0_9CLOT|nr:hypothetical protein [Clostridium cavendishii]SHJ87605.1 hypothetical protein SAMN02745163_02781 [Clostridium cavendishii DSM 21758]